MSGCLDLGKGAVLPVFVSLPGFLVYNIMFDREFCLRIV